MVDKLFTALEDIYFTVIQEHSSDTSELSTVVVFSGTNLQALIDEFKDISKNQIYIGKSGNQFKLLKLATLFLNYVMYHDDGVFSLDEQASMKEYIKNKLSRLTSVEKEDLNSVFDIQVEINDLHSYVFDNELPYRSIDMILDKIIDHTENQPRYFKPLEDIYSMLIEEKK